jgi:hypothetical protein
VKVPTEAEVAKIIARRKPRRAYLAPILAKQFVARLDHGYMPVLRASDRAPIKKAHGAATKLLAGLNNLSPDALEAVLGCFLSQRNADGLSSDPDNFKGQIAALVEALADTGREIGRRSLRPDAKTERIAVTLAAWDAWDEGEPKDRFLKDGTMIKEETRRDMPEGLRGDEPFMIFLAELLGACGLPPQEAMGGYRAALEYLKNHR